MIYKYILTVETTGRDAQQEYMPTTPLGCEALGRLITAGVFGPIDKIAQLVGADITSVATVDLYVPQ